MEMSLERIFVFVLFFGYGASTAPIIREGEYVVFHDNSTPEWDRFMVTETRLENCPRCPVRLMRDQESDISAIDAREGATMPISVLPYTISYHIAAAMLKTPPTRALFLGAGGCVGPLEFEHFYQSLDEIHVVDIAPQVLELAVKYFGVVRSKRMNLHAMDAVQFLELGIGGGVYSFISMDIFDAGNVPQHVATDSVLQSIYDQLETGGVFIINSIAMLDPKPEWEDKEVFLNLGRTMERLFGHVCVLPVFGSVETWEQRAGFQRKELYETTDYFLNVQLIAMKGEFPKSNEVRDRLPHVLQKQAIEMMSYIKNPNDSFDQQLQDIYEHPGSLKRLRW